MLTKLGNKSIANNGKASNTNFTYTLFLCSLEKKMKTKNEPKTTIANNAKIDALIYKGFIKGLWNQTPLILQIFSANETSFNTSNLGNMYFSLIFSAVK